MSPSLPVSPGVGMVGGQCLTHCVCRENHFIPVLVTGKARFHPTGFYPAWTELGSNAGAFAEMRTTLEHLTLLYILHRPILS